MKKTNVLFVMLQMEMGGTENLILKLLQKIDLEKFNPCVAWFYRQEPLGEYAKLGIPLFYIPKRHSFDINAINKLRKVILDMDICVINAHHFMPFVYSYLAACLAGKGFIIYTEHSEEDVLKVKGFWKYFARWTLGGLSGVVGVNDAVSNKIKEHFMLNGSNLKTIRNGVDLEDYSSSGIDNENVRRDLGISEEEVVIGMVANFRKNKNHIFLLKAFKELMGDSTGIRLVLIGQGFDFDDENSEPIVRRYIFDNALTDKVLMLGYRSDVRRLLNAIDIFCLVSYKEGLPISLIEAMSTGKPVIGTNVVGIRDVVEENENGFLVAPDDVVKLSNILKILVSSVDLRSKMGRRSRDIAELKYSFERCVLEYENLYAGCER